MLLVVITTATADDSFPDGSSSGSSSTASAAMLFEAVQYLRPLPESWSPNISLDQWEGVSVPPSPTCFHPGMPLILYAIVIVADDFSSNATLRLDLLDPMAPMCNITVVSSSAASITVIMNVSHLPVTLQFLDVSETDVFTTSPFNNRYVDFAKMPTYLGYFDFSYTGIGGNLDLSLMGQTEGTEFSNFNATGNVGLVGGVDLTGAFGPNIDLRGTGISTVVVQASQQNIVGPSPSSGPDCTIFVDATVTVLPVTIGSVFLLEQGYYCMPPPNSSSEFPLDRGILNVFQADGKNLLRMINPPYQCETPFDPLVTFNEGYVMNSTVLAMLLYPCVSLTLDYMQKLSNPGTQIGAIDAVTKETTIFGDCQYLEVGADAAYYSVTLSEDAFMDFNNTGYNVTARGYHESGELATCVFAWPLYINNPTWGTRNVIWNDRQLISDLAPCLPRRSGNITFSNWTSVTYLIPDSLILTDDEDRVLVLTTPSSNDVLVFTPFTYDITLEFCLVTATFLYRWTVSAFSSTIVVANANKLAHTMGFFNIMLHHRAAALT